MFKYVDLFAGCGGLSLGVERAGGELVLAVEKSDMAARTFYFNFFDDALTDKSWREHLGRTVASQVERGIAVKPLREVLDDPGIQASLAEAAIDVVVGGPPCQGFSLAGRRNPDDIRNKLPWEFLEFVELTNPKIVVIENVVGMSHRFSNDSDAPFEQLKLALSETGAGYEAQGVAVNALHYGAPQNRPRLMIIALRKDLAAARSIQATREVWKSAFADELLGPVPPLAPLPRIRRDQSPTLGDAIGDLQTVYNEPNPARAASYRAELSSRVEWGLPASNQEGVLSPKNQQLRNHKEGTMRRFRIYQWLRDTGLSPRMFAQLGDAGTSSRLQAVEALRVQSYPAVAPDGTVIANSAEAMLEAMLGLATRKHSQVALSWDKPARTVVTLPDDYVHPSEPRIFTVRELARLQGFPDDFEFQGKETTGALRRRFEVPQYSQVGNAVSPFLSFAVGKLIAGLSGESS